MTEELPDPSALCDVPWVASTVLERDRERFVAGAEPGPAVQQVHHVAVLVPNPTVPHSESPRIAESSKNSILASDPSA